MTRDFLILSFMFEILYFYPGVIKKDAVKSKTEELAADLFGRYKEKYVEEDGTVVMTSNEILSVNTLQNVVGCCG